MLGLNTLRGNVSAGDNGLSALPGRETEARSAIDQAVAYASDISASAVHVMAGNSSGPRARTAFINNLVYACDNAGPKTTILIEPLNHYNAPGYFLATVEQAADIIREVDRPNLKMMFDFYHVQIMGGDVTRRFEANLSLIGHVQIASVPDRGSPDHGELDYSFALRRVRELGWSRPIGAEYLPANGPVPDLAWLAAFRQNSGSREEIS
jgi:hydroxypyruvate isomerase